MNSFTFSMQLQSEASSFVPLRPGVTVKTRRRDERLSIGVAMSIGPLGLCDGQKCAPGIPDPLLIAGLAAVRQRRSGALAIYHRNVPRRAAFQLEHVGTNATVTRTPA